MKASRIVKTEGMGSFFCSAIRSLWHIMPTRAAVRVYDGYAVKMAFEQQLGNFRYFRLRGDGDDVPGH